MELDPNFSRILQKKREEQLEASRQKLFESNASRMIDMTIDPNVTTRTPDKKTVDLENSMLFASRNKSLNQTACSEDSFLALERQCNLEDKKERIINANDTLLFDVEPPADMWNETVNQTSMMPILETSQQSEEEEEENDITQESFEISPCKYIGLIRPSTIIEETSSQMESSSKNSSKSSSINTTEPTNESFKSFESSANDSTLSIPCNSKTKKAERQSRRETFAFKRRNYTFFPDENLEPIDETGSILENTENDGSRSNLLDFEPDTPETPDNQKDQFNDTLEAMDHFLEKGRQLIEQTPISKRNNLQRSVMETPLFSCKRKRILDEMAMEMLPLPKRGPLIDFSTPESIIQPRASKFVNK